MQKSNFGVSVGVVGAAAYLLSLFGGYIPTLLLVGYILLFENNNWLKRTAVKAAVLTFMFSLGYCAINLLPDCIGTIDSFVSIFGGNFYVGFISQLCNALHSILNLTEIIVLVLLSLKALKQSTIVIGFVDKFVNKCVE